MQPSRVFNGSYCSTSPNGKLVATLSSSSITLRSTRTLQVDKVVKLPPDLSGPVSTVAWSPSSSRLLVHAGEQIRVFFLDSSSFQCSIRQYLAGSGKPALVQFGARDTEVIACSALGLNFVIFQLDTSRACSINSPKFYLPSSATRGFSLRPQTPHLALLTRESGKDCVSIHHPVTRQIERSWYPETVDAQGLTWTPDGNWLLLWESPAHGHKLLLYFPDGVFFRSIGPSTFSAGPDADLEPGIKLCRLSPDAALCALGDYSRTVTLLGTRSWRDSLSLLHPSTIVPKDTLQVWQEQLTTQSGVRSTHTFLRATQMVSPPSRLADGKSSAETRPGPSAAAFDASSSLLATRLDDSPCTLWIWDVAAGELRAVLIFHSNVDFTWHPAVRELLLVTCQDGGSRSVSYIWDPLSNGPNPLSLAGYLPDGKIVGKPTASWVDGDSECPVLVLSDAHHHLFLAYGGDTDQIPTPWREAGGSEWAPGSARDGVSTTENAGDDREMSALMADDTSPLEDTFSFKHT